MDIILKNTIFGLSIVIIIWVVLSVIFFSGTFYDKYSCEDFEELGYDVKSDIKLGFFFIPYHRCVVNNDGIYVLYYKITGVESGN